MTELLELRDARQMRALAHPLRLRILAFLQSEGPSTATRLAETFGESVASLSYHLRQLARHGYVEEALDLGRNRKERPWRARAAGERIDRSSLDSVQRRPAAAALIAQLVEESAQLYFEFLDRLDEYPSEWRRAAIYQGRRIQVTPGEVDEIRERLQELFAPYERESRRTPPAGAELVHLSIQAVPVSRGR